MGLLDYVYRLKPESGDTTPHNELDAGQTISGGTISLVDLGGGVYAWRFSGSDSSGATDAFSLSFTGSTTGLGCTVAVRLDVTTNPSADDRLIWYGEDTNQFNSGVQLRQGGSATAWYAAVRNAGATAIFGDAFSQSGMMTVVMRLSSNVGGAGNDRLYTWWTGGGAGPAADSDQTGSEISTATWDTINIRTNSGAMQCDVRDIVIWHEELSNADCDSVRDDIDAALGGGGGGGTTRGTPFGQRGTAFNGGRTFYGPMR